MDCGINVTWVDVKDLCYDIPIALFGLEGRIKSIGWYRHIGHNRRAELELGIKDDSMSTRNRVPF